MEFYNKLKENDLYPFHMPGHKRNSEFDIPSSEIDITEISGFDNLHSPVGIIKDMQESLAKLYGYKKSIISVNGSTGCILAAISAVSKENDTIIIARNCHKSVYNACFINKLKIEYIEPEYNSEFGCYKEITQAAIDKAIEKTPNACAAVITSPTYEGYISDITCPIPLIIDAAHGAHFGFADYLSKQPKADIIIESLHKTLPALTQSAVIHIDNLNFYGKVKKYMDIYETSSPSYVIMASIDKCIDFLSDCKNAFSEYKILLDDFYKKINELNNIHILNNDDITRIVLSADGYSGCELSNFLRENGIEPEGDSLKYVILISTVCDTKKGFDKLINALSRLEKREAKEVIFKKPALPLKKCEIYEIKDTKETDLAKAENQISGEYVYAYPPGSPIIAPGEIISGDLIKQIGELYKNGVNILSDSNLLPLKILTKK